MDEVKPLKAKERLEICRSCSFFVPSTQSCGPLIFGKMEMYQGKKIRLCGCVMPIKVELKFAKCPAKKWTRPSTVANRPEPEYTFGVANRPEPECTFGSPNIA